ncbi:MAG: hypothetical protein M1834_007680 [Cirrosporium novae-zelandiae]|nr:MAG: hypothetical protein M1834_007680 [Cirrosporium novae-zelandiae]
MDAINPDAPTAHMATTTLRVDGMTCGACTAAVEGGFETMNGVENVSVSLIMGRAVVRHDPSMVNVEQVKETIEDCGFDAEVLSTDLLSTDPSDKADDKAAFSTTTLAVEGMTCGACTSAVEGAFKNVDGVKTITVSLMANRAVVEHDELVIKPDELATVIEDIGFDAKVLDVKTAEAKVSGEQKRRSNNNIPMVATTTVAVEGMTCGACTAAVENAFKDVKGMVRFNISLLAERAVISHDPSILSVENIMETIEDTGFDARLLSTVAANEIQSKSSATTQLKLFGLQRSQQDSRGRFVDSTVDTEAAVESASLVAAKVENTLRQLPGVIGVTINVDNSRATVTYDPLLVGLRRIVDAVPATGCNAILADSDDNNAQLESLAKTKEIQEWWRTFKISLFLAIPVFCISMLIPMYLPILDYGSCMIIPGLYVGDIVCMLLTIPVQFGIGARFYKSAFKSLRHGSPTMDVLVVLGTSAAFFFSVTAILVSVFCPPHTRPGTVFDTSTMLITFITLGRYLENRAKGQTSRALSRLMSLAPSMATIYVDPIAAEKATEEWSKTNTSIPKPEKSGEEGQAANPFEEKKVSTDLLETGDLVLLRPGDQIPADGIVFRGETHVDESMVTGEANPIVKKAGSILMAGTVNGSGRVDFKVTRAGSDTKLSQIVRLVQDAQTSRAPIQRMADVVAGYFVPAIIALGLLTFMIWMVLSHALSHPPKIFLDEASGGKLFVCLKLCISVIVFACPCALGLSTPTAVMVGTGVGAENGILFKSGASLETTTKINHIVFDKTGTLTMGKMSLAITRIEPVWRSNEWRRRLWWTLVGLAEMGSEHPVAKAIVNASKSELGVSNDGTIDGSIGEFSATVGNGVSATVEPASSTDRIRYHVLLGTSTFLQSNGVTIPPSAFMDDDNTKSSSSDGTTSIYIAIGSSFAGILHLSDTIKPLARSTIIALHAMNISTSLLTGDTLSTAHSVAARTGIPPENVHASVTPPMKQSIIADLQADGYTVAMVGDGINDSPALATAAVGIALASGTDVAMEAADIVLMQPEDLLLVPAALCLAKAIFGRIKLNLAWATIYNVLGLPFAMGLFLPFGGPMVHPMAAGMAMAASSVSVVASSLLLKLWKRPKWLAKEELDRNVDGRSSSVFGRWARGVGRLVGRRSTEEAKYVPLSTLEPA